jgi:hypothetical protein
MNKTVGHGKSRCIEGLAIYIPVHYHTEELSKGGGIYVAGCK